MMSVAYRLKTRVVLRDHGQQRSPSQAYTCFSHELAFNIGPSSTPNSATLDAIQRARQIQGTNNIKQIAGSMDTFQMRASLSDQVASSKSPSAIEALVRLDQLHKPSTNKSVTKITGKLVQVLNYSFINLQVKL